MEKTERIWPETQGGEINHRLSQHRRWLKARRRGDARRNRRNSEQCHPTCNTRSRSNQRSRTTRTICIRHFRHDVLPRYDRWCHVMLNSEEDSKVCPRPAATPPAEARRMINAPKTAKHKRRKTDGSEKHQKTSTKCRASTRARERTVPLWATCTRLSSTARKHEAARMKGMR